jgi:DNA-binding transcriptional regulator YhcF (GntR family)
MRGIPIRGGIEAMRVWLARGTSISLKEQLSTQLLLGILSGRYPAGEKLPSVRELARHLRIHSNTVSAAYRDLAARGWVRARTGSGVFVRPTGFQKLDDPREELVRTFVAAGAAQGFTLAELQDALARFASLTKPRSFIVADPELEFAQVLAAEISEGIGAPVGFTSIKRLLAGGVEDRCALVNAAHLAKLPAGFPHAVIRFKAVEEVVAGQTRPPGPVLVAVVSRSEEIHRWSLKILAALGFPPDSVLHRNPRDRKWQDGLAACDIVAADVVAAAELPAGVPPIRFRMVSHAFIAELL